MELLGRDDVIKKVIFEILLLPCTQSQNWELQPSLSNGWSPPSRSLFGQVNPSHKGLAVVEGSAVVVDFFAGDEKQTENGIIIMIQIQIGFKYELLYLT